MFFVICLTILHVSVVLVVGPKAKEPWRVLNLVIILVKKRCIRLEGLKYLGI